MINLNRKIRSVIIPIALIGALVVALLMHFFVDRGGIVKKVVSGVLTSEEFDQAFSEI